MPSSTLRRAYLTLGVRSQGKEKADQARAAFRLAATDRDAVDFIGINDPLGLNPMGTSFSPKIFDLYARWAHPVGAYRRSPLQ